MSQHTTGEYIWASQSMWLTVFQFIKRRGENVTEPVVRRATSGMKEADINYLAVLDSLFLPLSKKRVKELGMTDEEEGKYVSRLSREIEASGKESNVASGKQSLSPWINRSNSRVFRRLLWSLRHTSSP